MIYSLTMIKISGHIWTKFVFLKNESSSNKLDKWVCFTGYTHLCAAKQHKIWVLCYDNLRHVLQIEVCKLCICLVRGHDAVHITATTLANQRQCHVMRYIDTSLQEVSGFICPPSPEQFSCPLPTALTRPENICHLRQRLWEVICVFLPEIKLCTHEIYACSVCTIFSCINTIYWQTSALILVKEKQIFSSHI